MASNDKTIFDPGVTVQEGSGTILESSVTVLDDGTTMLEAVLSDAAGRMGAISDNAAIMKGDTIFNTYRVESDAIKGGMGSVWRVHHMGWNVDLAMKRPQPQCFSDEKSKADFIHECESWINLGLHPNIVSCYYVREIGGTPSIFSEWMDGGSLEKAIQTGELYRGTADEQQARILDIAIQFARGLHYAHEAGLIHQDVKPDNVLLTKEGEAKVADFGLARARAVLTVIEGDPTRCESEIGGRTILSPSGGYTPAYCSMEQMDGKPLTRRTDIYSWAVSVMEMYLGCCPWANGVVAGLSCAKYFVLARVCIPEALKELLAQCLDGEPENRPHNFEEIEARLHPIYISQTGNAYPSPVPKAAADTADSLNNRALSMLDLGKSIEAEKVWETALQTDLSNFRCQYNYAAALWNCRKIDDVEFHTRIFRQREHSALWAQAMATVSLIRRNDDKEAKECVDMLSSIDAHAPILEELRERLNVQLSIGGSSGRPSGSAVLYNIDDTGKVYELTGINPKGSIKAKRSPDGRCYLTENGICLDAQTMRVLWNSPVEPDHYNNAYFAHGGDAVLRRKNSFSIVNSITGQIRFQLEGDWYLGIDFSRDGRKAVYSLKEGKSYCVLDLITGSSSVFTFNGVYLGRSCFANKQGSVVACTGDAVRFFDSANGRSLLTVNCQRDNEDDILYDYVETFSDDGFVMINNHRRKLWLKLPDVSVQPIYELSVVSSLYERSSALYQAEQNYVGAQALFDKGDAIGAFRLLDKSRANSTLQLHEPSLKLWTKLGPYFQHGKLITVLPTDDDPTPLPQRVFIAAKAEPGRANYASDGTTVATVSCTRKMTENHNNGVDLDYDYSLSACDAATGQPYFSVRDLTSDSRTDAEELDEVLHIDLLPDGKLRYGKRTWNSMITTNLCDPQIQINIGLSVALPGEYCLLNTKEGVDIGGFLFHDVFDGLRPLWNAEIVACRKRNYRLVYQFIDPKND